MTNAILDVWLYGDLAHFAGQPGQNGYANIQVTFAKESTIGDLLDYLQMPTQARGVTFINGELSAMPGLQPDLDHHLQDGDRVAFFHLRSMWPFQYRFGVVMVDEMSDAMKESEDQGLHHGYG